MNRIISLNGDQSEFIRGCLDEYNAAHIRYDLNGSVQIGIEENGAVIAGLLAYITVYKILYVDIVFVDEAFRRKGYGTALIREMERQAKQLGVNTIRLDTFNWQGTAFYKALGYQEVGNYTNDEDGFSESFFVKRI